MNNNELIREKRIAKLFYLHLVARCLLPPFVPDSHPAWRLPGLDGDVDVAGGEDAAAAADAALVPGTGTG